MFVRNYFSMNEYLMKNVIFFLKNSIMYSMKNGVEKYQLNAIQLLKKKMKRFFFFFGNRNPRSISSLVNIIKYDVFRHINRQLNTTQSNFHKFYIKKKVLMIITYIICDIPHLWNFIFAYFLIPFLYIFSQILYTSGYIDIPQFYRNKEH